MHIYTQNIRLSSFLPMGGENKMSESQLYLHIPCINWWERYHTPECLLIKQCWHSGIDLNGCSSFALKHWLQLLVCCRSKLWVLCFSVLWDLNLYMIRTDLQETLVICYESELRYQNNVIKITLWQSPNLHEETLSCKHRPLDHLSCWRYRI